MARHLAGMQTQQYPVGRWEYPLLEVLMAAAGLEEVETYPLCHNNTTDQYTAAHPILEMCLEAEWQPGAQVEHICWEQGGLDLE